MGRERIERTGFLSPGDDGRLYLTADEYDCQSVMDHGATMKRRFLVVYDYGQGGAWAFVMARSASEIERKFPELSVVERQPDWMSKDPDYVATLERDIFDIDRPEGWLASLLAQREARRT